MHFDVKSVLVQKICLCLNFFYCSQNFLAYNTSKNQFHTWFLFGHVMTSISLRLSSFLLSGRFLTQTVIWCSIKSSPSWRGLKSNDSWYSRIIHKNSQLGLPGSTFCLALFSSKTSCCLARRCSLFFAKRSISLTTLERLRSATVRVPRKKREVFRLFLQNYWVIHIIIHLYYSKCSRKFF